MTAFGAFEQNFFSDVLRTAVRTVSSQAGQKRLPSSELKRGANPQSQENKRLKGDGGKDSQAKGGPGSGSSGMMMMSGGNSSGVQGKSNEIQQNSS